MLHTFQFINLWTILYIAPQKHESTLLHTYVLNEFWRPTIHVLQQNIFENLL